MTRKAPDPESGAWLLSLIEVPRPLRRGDKITDPHGDTAAVYEVRRLRSISSPIGSRNRTLWIVLHSGSGSAMVFVCLNGRQREWTA